MTWGFALVNNKLAEIFFERKSKRIEILGYVYVKASDYKSLKEKKWIEIDTKHFRLVYRNGAYKFKKGHEIQGLSLIAKEVDLSKERKFSELDLVNI